MSVPRFAPKHDGEVVLTPGALLAHRTEQLGHRIPADVPHSVILTYQPQLLGAVRMFETTTPVQVGGFAETIHAIDRTDGRVGVVGGFGIGAPAAAAVLEELISYGCDTFMSVGAAGALPAVVGIGDLVVCDEAIRDEGVSHHYVAAESRARPDPGLTEAMVARFANSSLDHHVGRSWTIDALFRETAEEIRHYSDAGVITVEMEAAALFVVAAHRGVRIGAAFCVSDLLTDAVWRPGFNDDRFVGNMWNLMESAIAVLDTA